jgi:hypothetical protein
MHIEFSMRIFLIFHMEKNGTESLVGLNKIVEFKRKYCFAIQILVNKYILTYLNLFSL